VPDYAFNRRAQRRLVAHDEPDDDDDEDFDFADDEPTFAKRNRHRRRLPTAEAFNAAYGLPQGGQGDQGDEHGRDDERGRGSGLEVRWSSWDQPAASERGPQPWPEWLVTELAAVDTELGILKTGKEADVFLLRRGVPDTERTCLLAAKRYRSAEHKMFHRDSAYLEGRRARKSRVSRAMDNRTSAGREMIATQWAGAEFAALSQLYQVGVPVPYPVQVIGTELLIEFIGEPHGTAAPRLAETRPEAGELAGLWDQLVQALVTLARLGLAHGDMSAYNLLVHRGRLVLIDLPQVVDVITNPGGPQFLDRDAANVARWFGARGLVGADPAPEDLAALLRQEAGLG
jgi:RIO kinase 1